MYSRFLSTVRHLIEMRGNGTPRPRPSGTRTADELWLLAQPAPMIRHCRNVIETTRTDRRARRAFVWERVALQISWPSSDAGRRSRLTHRAETKGRPDRPLVRSTYERVSFTFHLDAIVPRPRQIAVILGLASRFPSSSLRNDVFDAPMGQRPAPLSRASGWNSAVMIAGVGSPR